MLLTNSFRDNFVIHRHAITLKYQHHLLLSLHSTLIHFYAVITINFPRSIEGRDGAPASQHVDSYDNVVKTVASQEVRTEFGSGMTKIF